MTLRIATRKSPLALWQARRVQELLALHGVASELVEIVTTGDRLSAADRGAVEAGGKGVWVKEVEEALLDGRADLAVHSAKDVPAEIPAGLRLAAFPPREDPRDVLCGARLADLRSGARVGTSSLRRQCQLLSLRPDLVVVAVRGNVDTRLRKLREPGREGPVDAVQLALAGVRRLGREGEVAEVLETDVMLPAPGQGVMAVETRAGDAEVRAAVAPLGDAAATAEVRAERALLGELGGGCRLPLAALARARGGDMVLRALVGTPDGKTVVRAEDAGAASDPVGLARRVAEKMRAGGADRILAAVAG